METIDITEIFRRALGKKSLWNTELFLDLLNYLASSIPDSKVDWDSGVPENWGSIILKESYVLVCLLYPLVILKENILPADIVRSIDVECLYVSSMDISQYRIDLSVLEELAGRNVLKSIDWENCSIQEIWWATVT
ncbi:MAG: hypothetical protein KA419_09380 [Acidobacteria bacterium]|nr:hypothetical protein [Acidobacteriota bacterium]